MLLKSIESKSISSIMSSTAAAGAFVGALVIDGAIPHPLVAGSGGLSLLSATFCALALSLAAITSKPAEASVLVLGAVDGFNLLAAFLGLVVDLDLLLVGLDKTFSTTVSKMETFLSPFFLVLLFCR